MKHLPTGAGVIAGVSVFIWAMIRMRNEGWWLMLYVPVAVLVCIKVGFTVYGLIKYLIDKK